MPNFSRSKDNPADELEITSRVMDTVQRQVASYRMSIEKLRSLRKEIEIDKELNKRIRSTPEEMAKILVERGIPAHLAIGMAAEDFQDPNFGQLIAMWTWDCCCTGCCVTSCIGTSFLASERRPITLEALFGEKIEAVQRDDGPVQK